MKRTNAKVCPVRWLDLPNKRLEKKWTPPGKKERNGGKHGCGPRGKNNFFKSMALNTRDEKGYKPHSWDNRRQGKPKMTQKRINNQEDTRRFIINSSVREKA